MKLTLQIALGIFIGLMTTAIVIHGYLRYQFAVAAQEIAADMKHWNDEQREAAVQREMRSLERHERMTRAEEDRLNRETDAAFARFEAQQEACKVTTKDGRVLNCGHVADGITSR